MKTLNLKWKRCNPKDPAYIAVYGGLKAIYEAKGKVKISGAQVNFQAIQATAINSVDRARGTSPWRVTIRVGSHEAYHSGKTFTEVKNLAFREIQERLGVMEKKALERATLVSQIETIYESHGQKVMGKGSDGHTTSGLKKHLAALQAGKFPWKMPPREVLRESSSKDSPARGGVVRIPVPESTRDLVLQEVKAALERRVQEKGDGAFVSIHELRGVLDEEWDELRDAMHSKDLGRIEAELMDWIVGAVFGLACIRAGILKYKHPMQTE